MRVVAFALLTAALPFPGPALAQPRFVRVTATSLQLPATPPETAYATTNAFPALSFTQPLALITPPDESRRLFVVEKTGRLYLIPNVTAAAPSRTLFLDLTSRVASSSNANDERGLLALAFHPAYATNGLFYVWYTLNTTTAAGSGLHNRLARFQVSAGNPNSANPGSEQPFLTQFDQAANHNGGEILFGPDGYLYLSVGDEGAANDTLQNSQRIDRDFFRHSPPGCRPAPRIARGQFPSRRPCRRLRDSSRQPLRRGDLVQWKPGQPRRRPQRILGHRPAQFVAPGFRSRHRLALVR